MTDIPLEKNAGPAAPSGWASLKKASELIKDACREKRIITVWGHDDLDGIASTAIMLEALKNKAEVNYYIPPKNGVHYGLDTEIIDNLFSDGTGLIITVDGGISNYEESEYCRKKGLALIITDHHELPRDIPPALAVVNPKIAEAGSPNANLCGAGVALYLAAGIEGVNSADWLQINKRRLAWASLATISDRVPLLEENRMIVKHGLKLIPEDSVLTRLAIILGFDLSHGLSPQITQNSFNSLFSSSKSQGHYHPIVELLLGNIDELMVKDLWNRQINWRRKFGQELHNKLLVADGQEMKIITVVDPDLQSDMIGPLAGGIRDNLNLPAIVIGKKENAYVGEARGFLPFDFVKMLAEFKEYFIQYGGHKQAAGFTVKPDRLDELLLRIAGYSADCQELILQSRPEYIYDYQFDNVRQLKDEAEGMVANGPYGAGNPAPFCAIHNLKWPGEAQPGELAWLDDLLDLQQNPSLKEKDISAAIDTTSTGQLRLEILDNQKHN